MTLQSLALAFHVVAGTVALAAFWTAAACRKGSRPHVLAGRVYLVAMTGIILSSIPLVARFALQGNYVLAAFFAFLLVLVITTCWSAWRAIRDRAHPERYVGSIYWVLTTLVLAGGIAIAALGLVHGSWILGIFGGIGILAGADGFRIRQRIANDRAWWLKEHMGAMIGNAVATHIAFFSLGLRSLLPGLDSAVVNYLAWFGPLSAALLAAWWLDRRYRHGIRRAGMLRSTRRGSA